VTGNVSISVELEAYNEKSPNTTEREDWRWRRATYGFNLTIEDLPDGQHLEAVSQSFCQDEYLSAEFKRIIIGSQPFDMCKLSSNITMNRTG
jgi:hypothetical protein